MSDFSQIFLSHSVIRHWRAKLGPTAMGFVQESMYAFDTLRLSHDLSLYPQRQVASPSC